MTTAIAFLVRNWRFVVVAAALVAASVIYRALPDGALDAIELSVIGAVPIGVAARLLGLRAALVAVLVEAGMNADLVAGAPLPDDQLSRVELIDGAVLTLLGLFVGARIGSTERASAQLRQDPVTSLPNRHGLLDYLEHKSRGEPRLTLALLQIDDLAEVNETFGYGVGDSLLRAVAERLRRFAAKEAFVARELANRFAVAWAADERSDAVLAEDLAREMATPFTIGNASLQLRTHASITRRAALGDTSAIELIHSGTRALERAVEEGQPWCAGLAPAKDAPRRLELLSELQHAIEAGELVLYYQPIVDLGDRSLRSFEALVRWQHSSRGLVPPSEFIPLAEQSGLILPLTEWVVREAARQLAMWAATGFQARVAVNIGAKTLASEAHLACLIKSVVDLHHIDPAMLVIEVTETDVMRDPKSSIAVLRALKTLGHRINVDDFGTGYSSLAYLSQLPIDGIKIDRSFIRTLLTDTNTGAIVRAAIDLAHALGLDTVAEGIETEAALTRLTSMGCDSGQGYVIARPMPANEVRAWVATMFADASPSAIEPLAVSADEPKATILLVEDEHRVRLTAHRMLSAQGYRVVAAGTASEAVQLYSTYSNEIDLVLTDMHLTDWRGHELAARLRDARPQLRFVFMSGDPTERRNAGTDKFLMKPFSKGQLIEEIKEALVA